MGKAIPIYKWAQQTKTVDCETVDCPAYDEYKDFKRDPAGFYVLIRPNTAMGRIEAAICDKGHRIIKIFHGKKSQDIYNAIFQYEKKRGTKWFTEKTHIAYLGKELIKAEWASRIKETTYFQD